MGSRAFWLMLVVDLLTTASKPFQWLVVEADWFVASTGFQEQADIESYLSQFGFEHLCSQLSDSLGPDPPVGARGGPDLGKPGHQRGGHDMTQQPHLDVTGTVHLADPSAVQNAVLELLQHR